LVGWHASAVSLPPGDVIFVQLASSPNDIIFLFTLGITNLSLYKHWTLPKNARLAWKKLAMVK